MSEGWLRRKFYHSVATWVRRGDEKLGVPAWWGLRAAERAGLASLPHELRAALDTALPVDPLQDVSAPPMIDVVIACAAKDISTLPLCLEAIARTCTNPVGTVHLVCPRADAVAIQAMTEAASAQWESTARVEVIIDDELLSPALAARIDQLVPGPRRGWMRQQVLKLLAVLTRADASAALVVDADTVLLRGRTWVAHDGRQALAVAREFHPPYAKHAERMWGPAVRRSLVSFVTHHQLMQREVLEAMFGVTGEGLTRWLDLGDWAETSAISEYHGYGSWLCAFQPQRVAPARFSNVEARRSSVLLTPGESVAQGTGEASAGADLASAGVGATSDVWGAASERADQWRQLQRRFPSNCSVSLHSYLDS